MWQRPVTNYSTYSRVCVHRALDVKASTSFMHVLLKFCCSKGCTFLRCTQIRSLTYVGFSDSLRSRKQSNKLWRGSVNKYKKYFPISFHVLYSTLLHLWLLDSALSEDAGIEPRAVARSHHWSEEHSSHSLAMTGVTKIEPEARRPGSDTPLQYLNNRSIDKLT